jgi:hypothetical protein
MLWYNLTFGRHKGKSLPQVILHDPDYFFWAFENGIFDKGMFVEKVCILEVRACNIKIPKAKPDEWCVRYYTDPNGRFAGFDIIEIAENSQRLERPTWVDFAPLPEGRLPQSLVEALRHHITELR